MSGSANPAAAPDGCSVRQGLEHAARFLKRHACQTPMLDAQLLLGQVLGVDRCALLRDADSVPLPGQVREFEHLLRRRALHEPVAYLTGNKEFWSLDFLVDPRVLIPRPDTETVMEEVQDLFMARAPARFIDVGCGCACLACALASMFPVAEGLAIDIFSPVAELAASNVERHGLGRRVAVIRGDLLDGVEDRSADLICANLPYVPSATLDELSAEISEYEPRTALDGGPDGLAQIDRLIPQAGEVLGPTGWLVLEVGDGQAAGVVRKCLDAGLGRVHTRADLSGVERVVAAQAAGGQ